MSIKAKLTLSYIAMVFIPIILSFLAIMITIYINVVGIEKTYNIVSPQKIFIKNPLRLITDANNKIFGQIKLESLKNPDALKNREFLEQINTSVSKLKGFIMVRKDNEIIYSGKSVDIKSISNELPKFGSYIDNKSGSFLINNESLFAKQQDFYFKDSSEGSVFLLTDATIVFSTIKTIIIESIAIIIIILIITSKVLSLWMSKSILVPINELKNGANKIKEGDLNFKFQWGADSEIGEVFNTFEEMRKKLKESLNKQMQYEENRKELISNISHDLKTPITSIKGYVEGIKDGIPNTPEKMNRYVDTIYSKTCSMDLLIDELFLYSKLDLNKLPFNFQKVNINNYITDIVEELRFDVEKENINIVLENNLDRSSIVIADGEKLKRVITNLVNNSIKYMDRNNGTIVIELNDLEDFVQVKVSDNGKGISSDNLPFIFDRFYRGDSSRNSSKGGSGLGLAISKKIIEGHCGSIWAESVENVGTTICFTLKKS